MTVKASMSVKSSSSSSFETLSSSSMSIHSTCRCLGIGDASFGSEIPRDARLFILLYNQVPIFLQILRSLLSECDTFKYDTASTPPRLAFSSIDQSIAPSSVRPTKAKDILVREGGVATCRTSRTENWRDYGVSRGQYTRWQEIE